MTTKQIAYDEVATAFLTVNSESEAWLDRVTGEVILINEDTRYALKQDPATLPDWEREEVARARRVLRAVSIWNDYGDADEDEAASNNTNGDRDGDTDGNSDAARRYVAIPATPSHEAFQDMEDFVATLPHARAAEALAYALRGGKPFRRFKDTLRDYPAEQEGWYKFEEQRRRERIIEWANDEGITLT